jgi:hypothetical protein
VTRHVPLPGAAELFRSTGAPPPVPSQAVPRAPRTGSGRQKHDAKITVYISDAELVALEQARLELRARHGLPVDRGRIVREAVAALLADLDKNGEHSVLVRRLTGDE